MYITNKTNSFKYNIINNKVAENAQILSIKHETHQYFWPQYNVLAKCTCTVCTCKLITGTPSYVIVCTFVAWTERVYQLNEMYRWYFFIIILLNRQQRLSYFASMEMLYLGKLKIIKSRVLQCFSMEIYFCL